MPAASAAAAFVKEVTQFVVDAVTAAAVAAAASAETASAFRYTFFSPLSTTTPLSVP